MSISGEGNAYLQVTLELLHSLILSPLPPEFILLMLMLNGGVTCAINFVGNWVLASLQAKPISLLPCYENCCRDCVSSCLFVGTFYAIFQSWGNITSIHICIPVLLVFWLLILVRYRKWRILLWVEELVREVVS